MSELISLLSMGVAMSTPLVICTLGGIFTHKAGVLNIALEGMMNMGAFGAILFIHFTKSAFWGCLAGIGVAMVFGLIFSLFSITLKSNNIITGLAINMLATSVTAFLLQALFQVRTSLIVTDVVDPSKMTIDVPVLRDIPILRDIFNHQTLFTYLSLLLLVVMTLLLYRTRFGTYVRVCGENEDAAKAVGIKVKSVRYAAVLISAVASAFAGINLAVENLGMYTLGMASGRGFICLAAIFCGKGRPLSCSAYALVFGLAKALQIKLTAYVDPATASLVEALPYLFIIVVMFATALIGLRKNKVRGFKGE